MLGNASSDSFIKLRAWRHFQLFYECLPNKTLTKLGKIRITSAVVANIVRNKLPMFAIWRAKKPRCFKNVQSLPCRHRSQQISIVWKVGQRDGQEICFWRKINFFSDRQLPVQPQIEDWRKTKNLKISCAISSKII